MKFNDFIKKHIVRNKTNLIKFIDQCEKNKNFNIIIQGENMHNKSNICNSIMKFFIYGQNEKLMEKHGYENYKEISMKQAIFNYDEYHELNLGSDNNPLDIFCKTNCGYDRMVYVSNLLNFGLQNQQHLKSYIDKYNYRKNDNQPKVYFIVETSNDCQIKDILKSRMNIFQVAYFQREEFLSIIDHNEKQYLFHLDEEAKTYLIEMPNINYGMIRNIFEKLYYNKNDNNGDYNISVTDIALINPYIDSSTFKQLISYICNKEFRNAVHLLSELYEDGYDVNDVMYFFYQFLRTEYLKGKPTTLDNSRETHSFNIIKVLCKYMHQLHDGKYNKSMLIFFTLDLFKAVHNEKIEYDKTLQ